MWHSLVGGKMHNPANLDFVVGLIVAFWAVMFALAFIGGPWVILSRRKARQGKTPPARA